MEVDDRLIVLILGWPGTGIIDTEMYYGTCSIYIFQNYQHMLYM